MGKAEELEGHLIKGVLQLPGSTSVYRWPLCAVYERSELGRTANSTKRLTVADIRVAYQRERL